MKKLLDVLARSKAAGLFLWVLIAGLFTAACIDQRMRDRELPVHPYIKATPGIQQKLAKDPVPSQNRLFILFIDMMRFESAMDSDLMPTFTLLVDTFEELVYTLATLLALSAAALLARWVRPN